MRIAVADLEDPHGSTESIHCAPVDGISDSGNVLYLPLPSTIPPRHVHNSITDLPPWTRRNVATVLGVQPGNRADMRGQVLADISVRVNGAPTYVAQHDDDGVVGLSQVAGPQMPDLDETDLLLKVRQADLEALLLKSGAHLPSVSMLHYEGPSGQHYGAFLRPGFALRTTSALDRAAFWLLADLRGRTNVLVDHWSMFALAHHAARYAAMFFGSSRDVHVDSLRSYNEPLEALEARLRRVFPEDTDAASLFLLSINSSGHMAHDLALPALAGAYQEDATVVALASSSSPADRPVPALSTLPEEFRRRVPEDCELCELRPMLVPIEQDTYLLRLAAYTQHEAIRRTDTVESTGVVEAYAGLGVFHLHKTHADGRHHAFYIDVAPMLTTERFQRKLPDAISGLTGIDPTVIIHPPSPAASALAAAAADRIGVEKIIETSEAGLNQLDQESRDLLCAASEVLIVDDVVITGQRIEGYRQQLIALRRSRGVTGEANLGCLVAMARARDPHALGGTKDIVHHSSQRGTFAAVETLYLPNWDEHRCPWCRELRMLDGLDEDLRARPLVADRLAQLNGDDLGDEIFFPWGQVGTPPETRAVGGDDGSTAESDWKLADGQVVGKDFADQYWELNPKSVFGELQGTDLVVSVAAAVHHLRHKSRTEPSRLDDKFRSPLSKILDPDLYLRGRFYEPVLIASILRAANEWDVRSPDNDTDLAEALQRLLGYLPSGRRLAGEVLIMAALGYLPVTVVADLIESGDADEQHLIRALRARGRGGAAS